MDHRTHDRRGSRGTARATSVLRPEDRDVPNGAAALAKGLYLLDVIGESEAPPRFTDLQAATGLTKGTLARMLNTLVLFRLVRHEDSDNSRSEEHTSELQSLMRTPYAVLSLQKKTINNNKHPPQ